MHKEQQKLNQGFTLIEILVVIAILMFILSFALIVDLNIFKSDSLRAEQRTLTSLLLKARSRAQNNMHNSPHGVCYIAPNYVLFRGTDCTISAESETTLADQSIVQNPGTILPVIVFSQLSGTTTETTLVITLGVKTKKITINHEGTIDAE